jgi:hypothetical protein
LPAHSANHLKKKTQSGSVFVWITRNCAIICVGLIRWSFREKE